MSSASDSPESNELYLAVGRLTRSNSVPSCLLFARQPEEGAGRLLPTRRFRGSIQIVHLSWAYWPSALFLRPGVIDLAQAQPQCCPLSVRQLSQIRYHSRGPPAVLGKEGPITLMSEQGELVYGRPGGIGNELCRRCLP